MLRCNAGGSAPGKRMPVTLTISLLGKMPSVRLAAGDHGQAAGKAAFVHDAARQSCSASPSCLITLSLCAPLGVAAGGACTTLRAAMSAARSAPASRRPAPDARRDADGKTDIGERRVQAPCTMPC